MSIDFLSTREGIDVQTERCAKLVAAVIAQALKDLMKKPTAQERKNRINTDPSAIRSVNFFKSKVFLQYSALIGMDGDEFMNRAKRGIFPQSRYLRQMYELCGQDCVGGVVLI